MPPSRQNTGRHLSGGKIRHFLSSIFNRTTEEDSGPSFDINAVTSALFSVDARQSTIETTGTGVTRWSDLTANANDATDAVHSTASKRPDYVADGLNGFPTLRTDGMSGQYLGLESAVVGAAPGAFTVYAVLKISANAGGNLAGGAGNGNQPYLDRLNASGGGPRCEWWDGSAHKNFQHSIALDTPAVICWTTSGTVSNLRFYQNGTLQTVHAVTASGTNIGYSLSILFSARGTANFWSGDMSHYTLAGAAHDDTERNAHIALLAADYGITLP